MQLADILITSLRRSMNGNLQYHGWCNFGKLMVQSEDQTVHLMDLSNTHNSFKHREKPIYYDVISHVERTRKNMLKK